MANFPRLPFDEPGVFVEHVTAIRYCAFLSGIVVARGRRAFLFDLADGREANITPKLLWLLGAILVLSPVCRFLYHEHTLHSHQADLGFTNYTWNHLDGLALGAIVAILSRRARLGSPADVATIDSCSRRRDSDDGGLLPIWHSHAHEAGIGDTLQFVPCNLAFAGLLGVFLLIGSGPWKRITTPSFMVFFGKVSYGLYLTI